MYCNTHFSHTFPKWEKHPTPFNEYQMWKVNEVSVLISPSGFEVQEKKLRISKYLKLKYMENKNYIKRNAHFYYKIVAYVPHGA